MRGSRINYFWFSPYLILNMTRLIPQEGSLSPDYKGRLNIAADTVRYDHKTEKDMLCYGCQTNEFMGRI